MTKPEIEILLSPLIQEYGAKYYGPARMDAIFETLRHLSPAQLTAVIQRSFASERQAPMAKDLLRLRKEIELEEARDLKAKREREELERMRGTLTPAPQSVISEVVNSIRKEGA
jgi:hypothetical protein